MGDVEVGPDGTIFVAQPAEKLIRVYDSKGRFRRNIGRDGAGPGEFRHVDTLGFVPQGLLALDRRLGRLTLFTPAGRYVTHWGVPAHRYGSGLIGTPPVGQLRNQSLIVIPTYQIRGDGSRRLPVLVFDSAGRFVRSIAWLTVGDQSRRAEAGSLRAVMPRPVSSHTLWAVARDGSGVILAHRSFGSNDKPGEVHILMIAGSGDTLLSKRYRVPAVPIPVEILERERDHAVERAMRGQPYSRELVAALYRSGWGTPPFQAPIDRVVRSGDGTIWMRRGAFGLDEAVWWVLNQAGEIVARITVPARLHVLRVSRDFLWGVETGEFDEPYIVRYRLKRPWRPWRRGY